jgi:hypothetical protein
MPGLTTYTRPPYSLKMSIDGKIVVQPGDWLSKYSWVFYGNYTSLDHFQRYDKEKDTGYAIENQDQIKAGEILVWVPFGLLPLRRSRRQGLITNELDMPLPKVTRRLQSGERRIFWHISDTIS